MAKGLSTWQKRTRHLKWMSKYSNLVPWSSSSSKANLWQVCSWQYCHIAATCFIAIVTHATILLVAVSVLAIISRLHQFFYVHCETTILQHHFQKDARTYCTIPNATTCQRPYVDAIDPCCNQNSHIATQHRHHDRAGELDPSSTIIGALIAPLPPRRR
jgi:hypothetical protein